MDLLKALGSASMWAIAGAAIAGCAGYPTNVASGGACQRTLQCGPGLVCSQGHCTSDLSMFGMGHPTNLDAGPDTGMPVDAAVPTDMGMMVDAAMDDANLPDTSVDAFTPPVDAFTPPVDAFTPPVDAFVPPVDAFTPPVDAFTPPVDAFTAPDTDVDAP